MLSSGDFFQAVAYVQVNMLISVNFNSLKEPLKIKKAGSFWESFKPNAFGKFFFWLHPGFHVEFKNYEDIWNIKGEWPSEAEAFWSPHHSLNPPRLPSSGIAVDQPAPVEPAQWIQGWTLRILRCPSTRNFVVGTGQLWEWLGSCGNGNSGKGSD